MNTSLHASGEDGNRVLYGRVTDEKGEPLPGVAVFPTNFVEFGAATDENGELDLSIDAVKANYEDLDFVCEVL